MTVEADCEDQGIAHVDRCVRFGCTGAKLELRGPFWCCPNCGSSYGENPHPSCPPTRTLPE
jgi:hypothetical protein